MEPTARAGLPGVEAGRALEGDAWILREVATELCVRKFLDVEVAPGGAAHCLEIATRDEPGEAAVELEWTMADEGPTGLADGLDVGVAPVEYRCTCN
ncbi:hypothetical protein CXY01_32350 [Cellulomonas xylanilytica]|uniref:Uncharacterized protein n=1 Tax=Cellulomonas xylanilytica TaxID=233583 RepID=A0A510VC27_9CELL|nr:hypothetical protein CXY01_32350 [Cellulomonas xylanilytica]